MATVCSHAQRLRSGCLCTAGPSLHRCRPCPFLAIPSSHRLGQALGEGPQARLSCGLDPQLEVKEALLLELKHRRQVHHGLQGKQGQSLVICMPSMHCAPACRQTLRQALHLRSATTSTTTRPTLLLKAETCYHGHRRKPQPHLQRERQLPALCLVPPAYRQAQLARHLTNCHGQGHP